MQLMLWRDDCGIFNGLILILKQSCFIGRESRKVSGEYSIFPAVRHVLARHKCSTGLENCFHDQMLL